MERWQALAQEFNQAGGNEALAAFIRALPDSDAGHALLAALFGNSPFLSHCTLREPGFLKTALEQGADAAFDGLLAALRAECAAETNIDRLMKALRIGKRRAALLIALADITQAWPLARITEALSLYAECALSLACAFLLRQAHAGGDLVLPHPEAPERDSGLIVLGMGKFGAYELNYSSDIDIIVFYDEDKITYTGRQSIRQCFVRLTQNLVKIMDERTADGYVFRTDLRLRPDPGSTPAAISLDAAETYYEAFGQNWERAAMIKARQVAGDKAAGDAFLKFLRPFIWRKNLDFAAIQDIHSIKRQINAHRGGHSIAVAGHNIKLGRGGIREIEFFAQTQQLIWGGRDPAMRSSNTVAALRTLAEAGHTTERVAEELIEAYGYLRRLEHRLQMTDDKQTQTLPANPEQLAELAVFSGYETVEAFSTDLLERLSCVEAHYARLFEDSPALSSGTGNLVFTGGENDPETIKTITAMGFTKADVVASQIRGWHHGRIRATRSTRAREMLTEMTPALLQALAKTANPDAAFLKFDEFLSRLPAGVPIFSLLHSNPSLLDLVAEIMGDAPRLAEHLSRNAHLLDSVLTPGFFDTPPPADVLTAELGRALAQANDFQEILDISRRWTNDHKFQVGVQILRNLLDAGQASRALSDIADSVLSRLQQAVEDEFARAHGRIPGAGAAILAMGKMGSREMTATSDLDLILIYDAPADIEQSNGARPLAPSTYFARLTQRLVNAVTAKTGEGSLYEVDMRLRPSGNAGPIASSLESFSRYHEEAAWTWEHQALTRARIISGGDDLQTRIRAVIDKTLRRERDPAKLLLDVADMRERMARELIKGNNPWEVKQRRGGLVDIEFIAQYLQLRHAHAHPELLGTGTAPVFTRAADLGLISPDHAAILTEAHRLWSTVQVVLRQTMDGAFTEESAPAGLKTILVQAAGLDDFEMLKERMDKCASAVYALFQELIDHPAQQLRAAAQAAETDKESI